MDEEQLQAVLEQCGWVGGLSAKELRKVAKLATASKSDDLLRELLPQDATVCLTEALCNHLAAVQNEQQLAAGLSAVFRLAQRHEPRSFWATFNVSESHPLSRVLVQRCAQAHALFAALAEQPV